MKIMSWLAKNQCMTFDIIAVITYLYQIIYGKEIPWYWCFIVMMVVENTFLFLLQSLQHI